MAHKDQEDKMVRPAIQDQQDHKDQSVQMVLEGPLDLKEIRALQDLPARLGRRDL